MIDLGTHQLHIRCEGQGTPTVVFDVGIGGRLEEWLPLQAQLAQITRACAYERAGYGQSELGPLPRHSGREADELRTLLRKASVPGPYLLVGHSLGALNVQVFAARYPEDAAGMVLLDPPPLGWLMGERYPELRQMADHMTSEWQDLADAGANSSDPQAAAQSVFFRAIASEHREMLGASAAFVAAIDTFGDIPLTVIASGVPNPMLGEIAEEYQQYWIEQSRAVSDRSSRGAFVLAAGSSHHLHRDASELVRDTIVSMVEELRGE